MIGLLKRGAVLLAAASLGVFTPSVQAEGASSFADYQVVAVASTGYSQLLLYVYSSGESAVADVLSNDYELFFTSSPDEWFGVFIYDYTAGAFTWSQTLRSDSLGKKLAPAGATAGDAAGLVIRHTLQR